MVKALCHSHSSSSSSSLLTKLCHNLFSRWANKHQSKVASSQMPHRITSNLSRLHNSHLQMASRTCSRMQSNRWATYRLSSHHSSLQQDRLNRLTHNSHKLLPLRLASHQALVMALRSLVMAK